MPVTGMWWIWRAYPSFRVCDPWMGVGCSSGWMRSGLRRITCEANRRRSDKTITWRDLPHRVTKEDPSAEFRVVEGANWQENIGRAIKILDHTPGSPWVVFDKILGYPEGGNADL